MVFWIIVVTCVLVGVIALCLVLSSKIAQLEDRWNKHASLQNLCVKTLSSEVYLLTDRIKRLESRINHG